MLKKILFGAFCAVLLLALSFAPLRAAADDTRVADAAMRGDGANVKALLDKGADVNGAQGDGMTALHWAASRNDLAMVQELLAAGAERQGDDAAGPRRRCSSRPRTATRRCCGRCSTPRRRRQGTFRPTAPPR